ncbi:MAG: substrate-binding domain-containing protein [Gammaproteobacteria bacterium]|nr:substrate-binding domain-containing protein [Gammaproteobacteria bacterium]
MQSIRAESLVRIILPALLLVVLGLFALVASANTDKTPIRLATTTSTDNSGLLAELLPHFRRDSGYQVHVIAVGTGKALRLGRDGDVDVVLVHAPAAEQEFVNQGHGVKRHSVMYNDFVIIGDAADPANIRNSQSVIEAFGRIQHRGSMFISRGDDSGTHNKERSIWQAARLDTAGPWYREAGQGMGRVIQIANELGAYTLSDRGTWLSYRDKIDLELLYQSDNRLFNPYGVIAVNPKNYPDINYQGAEALIDWLTSRRGQQLIGDFKISGQVLFTPSADMSSLVNN